MSSEQCKSVYPLVSSDNVRFDLTVKALNQSTTLSDLVINLDCTPENAASMDPIPLSNVDGKTLKLVVEWCERHRNDAAGESYRTPFGDHLPEWDQKFVDSLNDAELHDLVKAANYLNIPGLMDVTCKQIADMIKGKTPEQLRSLFGISADEEDDVH